MKPKTFIDWLISQSNRDDLVGDIANDTNKAINKGLIPNDATYRQIYAYIKNNVDLSKFFIQHTDKSPETKREKIEQKLGIKLTDSYINSYSPLYCLKLAFKKYKSC